MNSANEKNLMDMPPIMARTAPTPHGGRGPRKAVTASRPPIHGGSASPSQDGLIHNLPMYTPGWSIPKLRLEDMDGSLPSSRVASGAQLPRMKTLSSTRTTKDMLSRFDEAVSVSNPNPKLTKVRSSQMRDQ